MVEDIILGLLDPITKEKKTHFCTVEGNYLIQLTVDQQDLDVFRKFIEEIDKIEILKLIVNIDEAQIIESVKWNTYSKSLFNWSKKWMFQLQLPLVK